MRRPPWTLLVGLWILLSISHASAEPVRAYLHTREVSALVIWQGGLWTATSGGIERYDLVTLARTHHLTQQHGLDSPNVLSLAVGNAGLVARTPNAECLVTTQEARCAHSTAPMPGPQRAQGILDGAPITQEVRVGERVLSATHGAGVWVRKQGDELAQAKSITPPNQVCTNHVQAMAHYSGLLWLGGFRDGLCVKREGGFEHVNTPFHFVNAMLATPDALYVAANEGLFRTRDGQTFERVALLAQAPERGVNGLASAHDTLWITTPTALYRLPLSGGHVERRVEALWTPGGSTAIQGLSLRADGAQHDEPEIWLASEDRGAIRVRGKQIEVFDALRGLDSSWVLDVAVDAHGTAYAATLRHGLFAIAPSGSVHKVALPSAWLLRLGWRNEALWVGTQDGLVTALSGASSQELALPGQCVHSVLEFEDTVWVGTEAGTFAL